MLRTGRPPEPNLGILADLFAAPQDSEAVTALLAHAIRPEGIGSRSRATPGARAGLGRVGPS